MQDIALITAMESEFEAVYALFAFQKIDASRGAVFGAAQPEAKRFAKAETSDEVLGGQTAVCEVRGRRIWLIRSGIGKVNAALAARYAISLGAMLVISTGLAGGIDTTLAQGDVVLADRTAYYDVWCGEPNAIGQVQGLPLYFDVPEALLAKIAAAGADLEIRRGLTLTGDQFLTDKGRLAEIKRLFAEGVAVDMESAAIAQVCHLFGRGFLSLRIISDVVGKTTQEADYASFWQKHPGKVAAMVKKVIDVLVA